MLGNIDKYTNNRLKKNPYFWIATALVIMGSLSFGITLQYSFCARMANYVELHNRIVFSLVFFPLLFLFGQFCFTLYLKKRLNMVSSLIHRGTGFAMLPVIFLSPLIRLFPHHMLAPVSVLPMLSLAAFIGFLHVSGNLPEFARRLRADVSHIFRVHYFFIGVLGVSLFVFTAEINEDFAVFESDGPYYGHFAQNILRYDVDYTYFLRTHGSGDIQQEKTRGTHNMRHPTGFTTAVVGYYLLVGSDVSPAGYRIFSLIVNLLTLVLLYRLSLKKTGNTGYAAFGVLMYLLVPIAIGFNMKIHQMVALNFGAFLLVYAYDKMIDTPGDRRMRYLFYALCFLTLHIDWYMWLLYPMFWLHYIIFRLRKRSDFSFVIVLPLVCIFSALLMLLQMYVAVESFAALEGIYKLRFENQKINAISTYKFIFDMSNYIVIHFTLIISVLGLMWPIHYLYRLRKGDRHPLDWITIFLFLYGVLNMVIFKKTRTHYFEVVHFVPYVAFAAPFLVVHIANFITRLPFVRHAIVALLLLAIVPQTIEGTKVFRLDTYRPYVSGFTEALDFVDDRLENYDTVMINWLYHRYKNERYRIRHKKLYCNTIACLRQKTQKEKYRYPRYAILFKKKQSRPLFAKLHREGAVKYFRSEVAALDLSRPSNVAFTDRTKVLQELGDAKIHDVPLTESFSLVASRLNTPVIKVKEPQSALHKYFQSWNDKIKEPVAFQNTIELSYVYAAKKKQKTAISLKTIIERVNDIESPITRENYQSNEFFPAQDWLPGEYINETLSFDLGETLSSGYYNVFLSVGSKKIFVDSLKVVPREMPEPVALPASPYWVSMKKELYKGMMMVGYELHPESAKPGRRAAITVYMKKTSALRKEHPVALSAQVGELLFPEKQLHYESPVFWQQDKLYAATAYFDIPENIIAKPGEEIRIEFVMHRHGNGKPFSLYRQPIPKADSPYEVLASVSLSTNPIASQSVPGGGIYDLDVSFLSSSKPEKKTKKKTKTKTKTPGRSDTISFDVETPTNIKVFVETFPEEKKRGFVAKLTSGRRQSYVDGFYLEENESRKVETTVINIDRRRVSKGKNVIKLDRIAVSKPPSIQFGWRSYLVPFFQPYINHFWGTSEKLHFPVIRNMTIVAKKAGKPGFFEKVIDEYTTWNK